MKQICWTAIWKSRVIMHVVRFQKLHLSRIPVKVNSKFLHFSKKKTFVKTIRPLFIHGTPTRYLSFHLLTWKPFDVGFWQFLKFQKLSWMFHWLHGEANVLLNNSIIRRTGKSDAISPCVISTMRSIIVGKIRNHRANYLRNRNQFAGRSF